MTEAIIFSSGRIVQLCPSADRDIAAIAAATIEQLAPRYGVHTPLRRAHFIAQVAHESAGFTRLKESLNYSALRIAAVWPKLASRAHALEHRPEALANAAYAGRFGNGDEASGDGWRFRGRGLIMLTFRANYRERGESIGVNLVGDPDKAADPGLAAEIALDYWKSKKCNDAADRDDVEKVTRLINGGTNGLEDRRTLTAKAKGIFVAPEPLIA